MSNDNLPNFTSSCKNLDKIYIKINSIEQIFLLLLENFVETGDKKLYVIEVIIDLLNDVRTLLPVENDINSA